MHLDVRSMWKSRIEADWNCDKSVDGFIVGVDVKTYDVTADLAGMSRKRKALRFFSLAGVFVAIEIALRRFWPSLSSGPLLEDLIQAVITGILFAVGMTAFYKRNLSYTIVVTDDGIKAIHPWFERSVQKDRVKTVVETEGNALVVPSLRISKYGKFGTFLWGCVSIPKTLPDYESIRDLALSWKRTAEI